MSKIKINLTSGATVEKALVTCFKGTNGDYIVFDNETNGPMGYPVICISKFTGTGCEKIYDPTEWGSVKDNLKTIIGGTNLPYLVVPNILSAQDDFFTPLTLPSPSFELLKNVYKPEDNTPPIPPAEHSQVVVPPVSEEPVMPDESISLGSAPAPAVEQPTPPVVEAPQPQVVPETPVVPEVQIAPMIVENQAAATTQPIVSNVTTINPEPGLVPTQTPVEEETVDIVALKENFMKSCENMFDGLVNKLTNKP